MLFIFSWIDVDFRSTCYHTGRQYFLLATQLVHLTTHKPIKIRVIVNQSQIETCAKRQHPVNETISVLNPPKIWQKNRKMLKKKYTIP